MTEFYGHWKKYEKYHVLDKYEEVFQPDVPQVILALQRRRVIFE